MVATKDHLKATLLKRFLNGRRVPRPCARYPCGRGEGTRGGQSHRLRQSWSDVMNDDQLESDSHLRDELHIANCHTIFTRPSKRVPCHPKKPPAKSTRRSPHGSPTRRGIAWRRPVSPAGITFRSTTTASERRRTTTWRRCLDLSHRKTSKGMSLILSTREFEPRTRLFDQISTLALSSWQIFKPWQ
jgi:hypothetical protein